MLCCGVSFQTAAWRSFLRVGSENKVWGEWGRGENVGQSMLGFFPLFVFSVSVSDVEC